MTGRLPAGLLFRGNAIARRLLYRSRLVARALYGAGLEPYADVSFWELGSVAMRQALARDLRDGMRALEIGTGPYAILSLWAAARWRLDLTATEIDEDWAAWARRCARENRARIEIRCTDLFEGIDGRFDAIWFVPPFTPATTFAAQAATAADADGARKARLRTCGGEHGWETIAAYLQGAGPRLTPGGRAYFCFNRVHQDLERMRALVAGAGLRVVGEAALPVLPYVTLAVTAADPDR